MRVKGFCTNVTKYAKYDKLQIYLEPDQYEKMREFLAKYDGKKPLFDNVLSVNCSQAYCKSSKIRDLEVRCFAADLKGQEVQLDVKPRKYSFRSQLDANRGEIVTGVSLYTTKAVAYELYKN